MVLEMVRWHITVHEVVHNNLDRNMHFTGYHQFTKLDKSEGGKETILEVLNLDKIVLGLALQIKNIIPYVKHGGGGIMVWISLASLMEFSIVNSISVNSKGRCQNICL